VLFRSYEIIWTHWNHFSPRVYAHFGTDHQSFDPQPPQPSLFALCCLPPIDLDILSRGVAKGPKQVDDHRAEKVIS